MRACECGQPRLAANHPCCPDCARLDGLKLREIKTDDGNLTSGRASEVRERRREYRQRPEVEARRREYLQRPEVKARRREYERRRYWEKRGANDHQ